MQHQLQLKLMGRPDFTPGNLRLIWAWTVSAFLPSGVSFDFYPPLMVTRSKVDGVQMIGKGLLTGVDRLNDLNLPDPDRLQIYRQVREWLKAFKGTMLFMPESVQYCPTYLGMGLEGFSYNLVDNPDFVHEVIHRYSGWTIRVLEHINELDFDFYWVTDDLACNTGPLFSPGVFQEFFLPYLVKVVKAMHKPWILHSDGNLEALLPQLLPLGFQGLHPIDPSGMDIVEMKQKYGDKICLLGNIDLRHTLTRGTLRDVKQEVKNRIARVAPGGRYIITSANSLTNYCKPQNVLAMGRYIKNTAIIPFKFNCARLFSGSGQNRTFNGEQV